MLETSFIDDSLSDDFWYDFGYEASIKTMESLSPSQWDSVSSNWKQQSTIWQNRLVFILDGGPHIRETILLLTIFREARREVSLTAAESLRYFAFESLKQICLSHAQYFGISNLDIEQCSSNNALLKLLQPKEIPET